MADILTDADIAALEAPTTVAQVDTGSPTLTDAEFSSMAAEADKFDQPLLAGAAGAARGLTFGASDVAGAALGYGDQLQKLREYNPVASTVGDVAATVGSAVTGMGAPGLISKVAAKSAQRLAGKGLAKAVLRGAAESAIEGGVLGVAQTITDTALARDYTPEQVAENLLANVGLGAVLGGGLGGTASALGYGGRVLKNKFFSPKPAEQLADDAARAVMGATDEAIPKSDSAYAGRGPLDQAIPNADEMAQASRELGIDVKNTETLLGQIQNEASNALGGSNTFVAQQFNKDRKKVLDGIVRDLSDTLKVESSMDAAQIGAQIKQDITDAFKTRQADFNDLYKSRNLDLAKVTPDNKELAQTVTAFRGIRTSPTGPAAKEIKQTTALLKNKVLKSLDDIDAHRSAIASRANALMRSGDTQGAIDLFRVSDALQRLQDRTILRAGVKATGGDAGLAKEFIRQNRDLSRNYRVFRQDLSTVSDLFKKKVKSPKDFFNALNELPDEQIGKKFLEGNLKDHKKLLTLKDRFPESFEKLRQRYVMDVYEKSVVDGELNILKFVNESNKLTPQAREAIFTPQGARTIKNLDILRRGDRGILKTPQQFERSMTGMLEGLSANVRDLGLAVVAKALGAADTATEGVAGKSMLLIDPSVAGAVKRTSSKIQRGVRKFIREGATPGVVKGVLGSPEQNKKKVEEYSLYRDDPNTLLAKVTKNTEGLDLYSPDTAMALTNNVVEATQFLASKIPPRDPVDKDIPYSDHEAAVFSRYARAVEEPMSVVDDIESGTLTPQAIEAVQTVYPELMVEIQSAAMDEIAKSKEPIAYDKKIMLSMLLGYPLSATMKPEFVAIMQQNPAPQETQGAKISSGSGSSNLAANYETQSQKILKMS